MFLDDAPLTRDRIVSAAEDVLRRFGPAKATVVDVARALGVSHAAVYRHVATKAELRDLVVGRWAQNTMPPLRAIAAKSLPAAERLRQLFDALIAVKRRRAAEDPELFAAYRTLATDAESVVAAHLDELVTLGATVIRPGVEEGTFRTVDPMAASRAVLFATSRFHHPVHTAEWGDPAIDTVYDDVWRMLMDGLCVAKRPSQSSKQRRQTLSSRSNMGAVLNIVGGPISLSYYILSPVEERIECLKDQCLVSFFFRVGHSPQYCSGSGA